MFTPLLASTTVGTLEPRSVAVHLHEIQPCLSRPSSSVFIAGADCAGGRRRHRSGMREDRRQTIPNRAPLDACHTYPARCTPVPRPFPPDAHAVDAASRTVTCRSVDGLDFSVQYDKLAICTGSQVGGGGLRQGGLGRGGDGEAGCIRHPQRGWVHWRQTSGIALSRTSPRRNAHGFWGDGAWGGSHPAPGLRTCTRCLRLSMHPSHPSVRDVCPTCSLHLQGSTFGIPGVLENAHFLRDVKQADAIRQVGGEGRVKHTCECVG